MRLHAVGASARGISLHPTAIHVAISGTFNPTVSAAFVILTQEARVDIHTQVSVHRITNNRTEDALILQALKLVWQILYGDIWL